MKKKVELAPAANKKTKLAVSVKRAQTVVPPGIGLTANDCICATMMPHCPVHALRKFPAVGEDVIRA